MTLSHLEAYSVGGLRRKYGLRLFPELDVSLLFPETHSPCLTTEVLKGGETYNHTRNK